MKVLLNRKDKDFHFEAKGASDIVVNIDAGENIGGHNAGARPMELLLMGLGGCSSIDLILILKKQRQELTDLKLEIEGKREKIEGTEMSPFTNIHIKFMLFGELSEQKVEKAIALSMEKYCSATAQLAPSAKITTSYTIN